MNNGQTFNVTIGANMDVSGALGGVKQLQSAFNALKLPTNMTGEMVKDFDKLRDSLTKFKTLASKESLSKADLKTLDKLQKDVDSTFSHLSSSFDELSGKTLYLEADLTKIKEARSEVERLRNELQTKLSNIKIDFSSPKGGTISLGINQIVNDMERGVKSSKVLSAAMKDVGQSIQSGDFSAAKQQITDIEEKAKTLKGASAGLLEIFRQWGIISFSGPAKDMADMDKRAKLLNVAFDKIKSGIADDTNEVKNLSNALKDASDKVANLEQTGRSNYAKAMQEGAQAAQNLQTATQGATQAEKELGQATLDANRQIEQLQQSTQYFFSLRNMINLLRRGVSEAIDTVKELDAAMTETAVVTDFSVGDMWEKLPEYTANANALGASVKDMYEATTLYYQQGLETDAAMGIANETMKMARIGGLEAADATDKMTAALRGFNMELNEASAQRVNDVYSNLAAKTASDTEELGTAMQRTASIAASAGMSFEGTAAFLAQAIETTREPAENLGTAMKTIVARFTELKENPLEITEVDGEEVSYNKVDTALQSIGVSLKDTNGQFRDLDQVFLDISQRWNSLTQTQQRYIATTAAGSRQQSRFIAMMSNYDRTVQLMDYANNSAGASNEQFGKTLEGLEAKLNKLKNAWDRFEMGIANNVIIKGAVDGLTSLLTITNNLIDKLSLGSGVIKSFLSIFTAFTGLKAGGRIINSLIGGLGGLIDPTSSFGAGLRNGLGGRKQVTNMAQAKAISTPIVTSLSKISGQIAAIAKRQGIKEAGQKGNSAGVKETSKEDYINTKKLFNQLGRKDSFKMTEASNLFGKLDAKHQYSMFNNTPGTKAAMKKASLNWVNSLNLPKQLEQEGKTYVASIYKGMEQGQIPVDKGIQLIGRPDLWGKHFGTETAKSISQSVSQYREAAEKGAWRQLGMKGISEKAKAAFLEDAENKSKFEKLVNQNIKKGFKGGGISHDETKGTVSDLGRFANDIGTIGDRFTQAGYGISAFGNLLSQLGGPIGMVGTGLQSLGGIISSLGMSFSAATNMFSLFTEGLVTAEGTVLVAGSTIATIAAPIAALGAALLIAHHHFKEIKEAGEEVTKTFNETRDSAEDNIAKLKAYRNELATLSQGVDKNGDNVNLDDAQYQRYLEIVDDIASISPEIVKGYNAQGHAIIDNNTALAETLRIQQNIRDEAYNTYTNEKSLQKLIDARNINSDYRQIQTQETGVSLGYGHGNEGRTQGIGSSVPLAGDVASIADKLSLVNKFDESMLKKYNIDSLESLKNGEEQAVKNFIKHRQQIEAELSNSGLEISKGITKGFDKLGEDKEAFDEAIKPVYDNLLASVSNLKLFDSIAPEFQSALSTGLKDIASQDLSASEMIKQSKEMALKFSNLKSEGSDYADALKIVKTEQEKFASSLNETEYKANVQPAIDDLARLRDDALNKGSAYGDALAEYLDNQIAQISNFTKEGAASLSEAINTMQDDIAAAEGALESFQGATKSDYSTAASGMKGIFEEIFKETDGKQLHTEGFGDQTFWKGAKELLSENIIDTGNLDTVINKLNKIKPALEDGEEGWNNFLDLVENTKGMDKWFNFAEDGSYTINIPEEQFSEVAKQLGVSENFLTSMLNKGRQFANISFSNVDAVRKALATSENTIKGLNKTNGNKNLYVKEESLRNELFNQGYVSKEDQDRQLAKYFEKGIKTIPAADSKELTKDKINELAQDWGIKTLPDLITKLNETGEFTKDEIQAYADKFGLLGEEGQFDSIYSDIISAMDNPELAKQTSLQQDISNKLSLLVDKRNPEQHKEANDEFKEMVYGKSGEMDTAFQKFSLGQNENGNYLSAGEYAQTKKNMEEASVNAKEAATKYKAMAEVAEDTETQELYTRLGKSYENAANWIDKWIEQGTTAYENQEAFKNGYVYVPGVGLVNSDTGEAYQQQGWQYGNVTQENRPRGLIDENGKNVTVLGGSKSFDTGEGKEVEIAFTPVVTLDGKGDILEDDTVDAYINTLIQQLQNEGKEVNLNNLLKLDSTGEIEGFEGIKNVIADVGNEASITAVRMHALEAGLDVTSIDAQYKQLSSTIAKVGTEAEKSGQKASDGKPKSTTDVQATTYEVLTAGAEGNLDAVTEKLDYLKDNYPEVYTELITEAPQYSLLQNYSEDIDKLSDKPEIKQKITADIAGGNIGNIESDINNLTSKNPQLKVGTNASEIQTQVEALIRKANKLNTTKNLTIDAKVKKSGINGISFGGQTITVNTFAKGHNNKINAASLPSFGSAAKGNGGTLGPKNKGGLTLTGELGYEIAWLPSEGRSVILGNGGPQMVDLPADAVVYTHEQSKDILKRKGIPAGSQSGEISGGGTRRKKTTTSGVKSKSKTKSKSSKSAKKEKSKEKKKKETPKIVNFSIEETVRFNIDARLEKLGYEIDKRTKSIEKTLGRVGTTSKSIKGVVQDQLSALQQQKQANSELLASYQRQSNEIFNWQEQFSYQAYQKTTTGKGKKKKTTNELTTLTGVYNLRDFMMQQADGSYTINEGMIAAIGNMEIEKQVHDSVSNAVSSINNGMIKAKQAMDEVDEKIEDLQNRLYETFNRWKKSIDAIYLISQKLETVNKRREIRESQYDVALLQLKTGFDEAGESLNRMIEVTSKSMNELAQSITGNYALISEKYKKYNEAIQLSNYNEYQDSTDAQDKYAAAQIALRLYQQYGGDMDKAINGIKQEIAKYDDKGYGVPTDEAVKEILDTIHERRMDLFDSINEVLSEISDAFEKFVEYQETVKSFEDELLDGLEKETEDQIDALSKLNDSLTKALKNLLDEVKRKLDERRRVEDNAKTELDIARKQQRLAALRANTSGGNQVEIAQLEKEIADSQQSYQRTLEDQLLDKLQQQADRAEQQREQQIQLLEILKDVESSTNKAEVEKWLNDPEKFKNEIYEAWKAANDYDEATTRGKELLDSQFKSDFAEVVVALGQLESLDDISNEIDTIIDVLLHSQSLDLSEDFMAAFLEDLSAVEKNLENAKRFKGLNFGANDLRNAGWDLNTLAQAGYGIGDLKEAGFSAAQLKALKDENGNNRYSLANLASYYSAKDLKNANYSIGELKNYFSAKDLKNAGFNEYDFGSAQISYANAKSVFGRDALEKVAYYKTSVQNEKNAELKAKQNAYNSALANLHDVGNKDQLLKVIQAGKSLGKDLNTIYGDIVKGHYHIKASLLSGLYGNRTHIPGVGGHNSIDYYKYADALSSSGYSRPELEEFLRHMALYAGMHFATGGLANFTGPAWLDGTPSKPELVLNAQDTKNFIALKDVLSHAMGTTKNIDTSYGGDNIYEININVDKIEKDYDVDRVAERVKKMIVKDSSYRNVTQVRNFR